MTTTQGRIRARRIDCRTGSLPRIKKYSRRAAVTTDVVVSEVGDIRRFGSQRKATAFAGLAAGIRGAATIADLRSVRRPITE